MKTTLLLFIAVFSIASTTEDPIVSAAELNKLTGNQWTGTFSQLNESSNEMETQAATLTVTVDNSDPLLWHLSYEYPDHPGTGEEKTLTLSSKGDKINGSRISDRAVTKEGVVKIITLNKDGANLYRKTYMIGDTTYTLRREQLAPGDEHFKDISIYSFHRKAED